MGFWEGSATYDKTPPPSLPFLFYVISVGLAFRASPTICTISRQHVSSWNRLCPIPSLFSSLPDYRKGMVLSISCFHAFMPPWMSPM